MSTESDLAALERAAQLLTEHRSALGDFACDELGAPSPLAGIGGVALAVKLLAFASIIVKQQ